MYMVDAVLNVKSVTERMPRLCTLQPKDRIRIRNTQAEARTRAQPPTFEIQFQCRFQFMCCESCTRGWDNRGPGSGACNLFRS